MAQPPVPSPTPWDLTFLANPQFKAWAQAQLAIQPLRPGQQLVDYVRERINLQNAARAAAAASPSPTPSTSTSGTPPPPTSTQVQQAHILAEQQRQRQLDAQRIAAQRLQQEQLAQAHALEQARLNASPAAGPDMAMQYDEIFDMNGYPGDPDPPYAAPEASSSMYNFRTPAYDSQPFASIDPALVVSPSISSLDLQRQELALQLAQNPRPSATARRVPPTRHAVPIQPADPTTKQDSNVPSPRTGSSNSFPSSMPSSTAPTLNDVRPPTPTTAPAPAPTLSTQAPTKPPSPVPTPAPNPAPAPSTAWEKGLPMVREQLTLARFTRFSSSTASRLSRLLAAFQTTTPGASPWGDSSDVPPQGRREVLDALVRWGGAAEGAFWGAWLGPGAEGGMEVLVGWLNGASWVVEEKKKKGKDKVDEEKRAEVEKTLGLVMQVLAALPLTFDHLLKYKVAKRVKLISTSDKVADPVASKIAKQLADRWMTWQNEKAAMDRAKANAAAASSSSAPKRKADPVDGSKKKAKVEPAKPVAPKPVPMPVASLFAAKTPLPSFKKEKKPDPPPPAPFDPFSTALKALGPKSTAAPSTPSAMKGKQRDKEPKRVRWETDDRLEKIKIIEKAIYDGDDEEMHDGEEFEGEHGIEAVRVMDEQEGQGLKLHLDLDMEEEVKWYEPIPIAIPNVEAFEAFLRPADSAEVLTQTAREATTMSVDLPDDDDGPPSAGEPPAHTAQDPPSKTIPLCPSLDNDASVQSAIAHAQAAGPAPGQFAQPGDISNLLSQLSNAGFGAGFAGQQGQGQAAAALGQSFLQPGAQPNYTNQNQQQQPSHGPSYHGQQQPDSGWGGAQTAWAQNQNYPAPVPNQPWTHQAGPPPPQPGRGVAIKGKRKSVPCKFFHTNKGCDWGDRCQFVHQK